MAIMKRVGYGAGQSQACDVETLFLPAAPDLEHISSSIVKDVARHGGDVTGMVPDCVIPLLGEALNNEKRDDG